MIPLRRPSGCRFADRLIMNERTPDGPPLVSFSGHCCKFSVGIRMIPKGAASAKPVTPPAGKLPQAVRTLRSLGELRGAFIEKQAACLSPVRCMPPLPSGERSDGVAGRTGLCTGAECDACEVISVALTASVKKGRPFSADTAFIHRCVLVQFGLVCRYRASGDGSPCRFRTHPRRKITPERGAPGRLRHEE